MFSIRLAPGSLTPRVALLAVAAVAGCDLSASPPPPLAPAAAPAAGPTAGPVTDDPSPPAAPGANEQAQGDNPVGSGGLERTGHRPAGRQRIRDCTFDDIKFDMNKEEPFQRGMLSPGIEALQGAWIRIHGYILPSFQQTGLTQLVLVRDNMECCFGPGAALFDCIVVEMAAGESTDYTIRPVAVEGIFSIREFVGPDGKHLAIYHLDGQEVK